MMGWCKYSLVLVKISRMERETHDEAEGEEGSSLEDAAGHVPAVVALAHEALVALELLAEGLLAADEEEEHGVGADVLRSGGSFGLRCLDGFGLSESVFN